jgi:hypothetical protein
LSVSVAEVSMSLVSSSSEEEEEEEEEEEGSEGSSARERRPAAPARLGEGAPLAPPRPLETADAPRGLFLYGTTSSSSSSLLEEEPEEEVDDDDEELPEEGEEGASPPVAPTAALGAFRLFPAGGRAREEGPTPCGTPLSSSASPAPLEERRGPPDAAGAPPSPPPPPREPPASSPPEREERRGGSGGGFGWAGCVGSKTAAALLFALRSLLPSPSSSPSELEGDNEICIVRCVLCDSRGARGE